MKSLKKGPEYGLQKAGCKKQGRCYPEAAAWPLLFLNYNDPVFFCTLFFDFGPFFTGSQIDPCF